ncbi:MAG: SAM-dependent methyltransferase [Bacteroidetes bacterium]|nr:SAM-dependent methyltransferase [Bacteroidota bacterium]
MNQLPVGLYLIPVLISETSQANVIPAVVLDSVGMIHHFLCEDVRSARRFVSSLKIHPNIENLDFQLLNKDTPSTELDALMKPLRQGLPVGVLSESGCPGVADPGSMAVRYAHRNGIKVIPLTGPSSLLLGLMASGLNGQQFAFHGYLPIESQERVRKIKSLELESREKNQTQIFIETPYRNQALLKDLVANLRNDTDLCVAINVTGSSENIMTMTVSAWRKRQLLMEKVPAVFLFLAARK